MLDGALKGVIMLQDTYDQNIKNYSQGHFVLKNNVLVTSRRSDHLRADDLAYMAALAFDFFKWYDASVRYLKEAIDLTSTLYKNDVVNMSVLNI